MRRLTILLILTCATGQSWSQDLVDVATFDSTRHKRIYQISVSDYQHIELVEYLNGSFSGRLVCKIWKVNGKDERTRLLQQSLVIPSYHVEELMNIALKNGLEVLRGCAEVQGCVIGLDGTSILFKINTPELDRNFWYWEPENDQYQDSTLSEIKIVRLMLHAVDERIDPSVHFQTFRNQLPRGTYAFGGIIMKRR